MLKVLETRPIAIIKDGNIYFVKLSLMEQNCMTIKLKLIFFNDSTVYALSILFIRRNKRMGVFSKMLDRLMYLIIDSL